MIIVGLTGGIGSGKTTVAKIFLELQYPVYFADNQAKKLMQSSETLKSQIRATFGDASYLNNTLNTAYLAKVVFTDARKLEQLNNLVHPVVKKHFEKWVLEQNADFVVYENAILFESRSYKICNYIICVVANIETRIKRVVQRDNTTAQEVIKRINNQWSEDKKVELSDALILNDKISELKPQILKIIKEIRTKFNLN